MHFPFMSSLNNVLYFQASLGILANIFLFFFYMCTILRHGHKPIDLIFCQLTFIHIMMVLTAMDIWFTDVLESLNFGNDFNCKAIFYINRVMRGLSICTTCLLTVFQAVTISPNTSLLAKFKHKLKRYMIHVFFCIWSLNLSFSSNQIFYVGAITNTSEINQLKVSKYCSLFPMNKIIRELILTLTTCRDVFLVGVMLTTSTYMLLILYRHQRRHQHLHSSNSRASPEKRATQTILLLVGLFVVMYWVDFIISLASTLLWVYNPVILTFQKFVLNIYPTFSPLIQISSDKRVISMLKSMQSKCHQF
uniref:Vomeronasal type-1 receptor n=1 Tax=Nannospalax galili TaxID=1026970 RepID=A0A4Y1N3H8_NANGA|nr:vomeronasal type 1 receptor 1 [Nannospalax galili]AWV49231.1 vomeronasal type 1 receptor 1 [Nannospalax galili]